MTRHTLLMTIFIGGCLGLLTACLKDPTQSQAARIVSEMSLREKVAQKIMMSFRYWCESEAECNHGLTEFNSAIGDVIEQDKIGGVILFANNLNNLDQTAELIWNMQNAVAASSPIGLFITLDQEGGMLCGCPAIKQLISPVIWH